MKRPQNASGQSAVEFLLVAPILFLLFFCVIQLAYSAYAALAVQRSAYAAARSLARSGSTTGLKFQVIQSLAPLASLGRGHLASILFTREETFLTTGQVTVTIHYPMPIWVPLAGRIFGEPLIPSLDYNNTESGQLLRAALRIAGKREPNLSFQGLRLPFYRTLRFQASAFREDGNGDGIP